MAFAISVVIATHNRQMALERLLSDLARQSLPATDFEVVVVDDGSVPAASLRLKDFSPPYALKMLEQTNQGPAAARHRGVLVATGAVILFVDDDMQLSPNFLSAHLSEHRAHGRCVVLGLIQAHLGLKRLPLFERFHATSLNKQVKDIRAGKAQVAGVNLCTGNVSMRRADYMAVGGFDRALRQSEDRDLGIRLELAGVPLFLSEAAGAIHSSDHNDLENWLDRSRRYGGSDLKIHLKNPQATGTSPWRYLFLVSPLSRPVLLGVVAQPTAGRKVSRGVMALARALDRPFLPDISVKLTTLAYGVEYFRGLAEASGSLGGAVRGLAREIRRQPLPDAVAPLMDATAVFLDAVREDFSETVRQRKKYHAHKALPTSMAKAMVEQVGFQMLTAVRLMELARDAGFPLTAKVASRLIRHLYGAEIHWDAKLAPGLTLVHGVGLIVSHAAKVEAGCVLFQNVTLGEALHPDTKERGAPHLEANVHVGPGCTILGPITVGSGTKLAAGSVLTRSVPPHSLVSPEPSTVVDRKSPAPDSAKPAGPPILPRASTEVIHT